MPQAIAKEYTCVAGSGVATGSHRIAVAWLSAIAIASFGASDGG